MSLHFGVITDFLIFRFPLIFYISLIMAPTSCSRPFSRGDKSSQSKKMTISVFKEKIVARLFLIRILY